MSAPVFPFPALADQDSATAWAHHPTTSFPSRSEPDDQTVVVLPIYGVVDHRLGLSLDAEEVMGAAVLSRASAAAAQHVKLRVLPPLRFGLAPYGANLGGIDPETGHQLIREIAQSVQRAGFQKLVFWVTSPWNSELIDAASRDTRVDLGLQTFVIEAAGLGLDLHPANPARNVAQALISHLTGHIPALSASIDPQPIDPQFRPGNWTHAEIPPFDPNQRPAEILASASQHLAQLLAEVSNRAPLGQPTPIASPAGVTDVPPSTGPICYPAVYRSRYLPSLSAGEIQQLAHKERSLVIITVGAIEQHGPHLPVGVDAIIAEAACAGLHAELPTSNDSVWFAPAITFGKSNEHLDFPGTISISAQSLRRLVLVSVRSLYALGFRQFALLNTHGGNSAVLVYTLREIQTEFGVRAGMLKIPSTPELSAQESAWGFHAGEWETSIMLAIARDLVRFDHAISHYPAYLTDPGELRPENASAIFSWMTRDIAADGVMGDATAASVEKGLRWFRQAMIELAAQVRSLSGN